MRITDAARLRLFCPPLSLHPRRWLPDALAGAGILVVAAFLSSPLLLSAVDLQTGAGDWHAHAFRVEEIGQHGPASWSHLWAGGMPLWEGYQALPHLVTLAVVRLTGLETTRVMVLLAGALLIVLRAGVYLALRGGGAAPLPALAGALAVCAFDTVRQPLANYSELWGVALAPPLLLLCGRYAGRPGGLVVAALCGLAVEVHPLLAATGALGLLAGFLASPKWRSPWLLAGQGLLFLIAAAVFWLPVVASARPAYSEPYFTSVVFARLLFRLGVAGFPNGWPLVAVGAALVIPLAARTARGREPARFLLLLAGGVTALVVASVSAWAPEGLREMQLARLVSLLPLLVGVATALLITALQGARSWRTHAAGGLALPAVAVVIAGLAAAVVLRGPRPPLLVLERPAPPDALSRAVAAAGGAEALRGRIWADAVLTAEGSYHADGAIRFAGSYSGREWSILNGPLHIFLAGSGDAATRTAYLVAHGVGAIFVPAGVRPEIAGPMSEDRPAEWRLLAEVDGYQLLATPWTPPLAWHLPRPARDGLTAPDARFRDLASSSIRDETVRAFAAAAIGREAAPAAIRYPTGSAIEVYASALDGDRYLIVNESWDRTWRARVGGIRVPVERFGPHQIGVDLAGLRGEQLIRLDHSYPRETVVGLLLSLTALPLGAALAMALLRRRRGMMRASDERGA